MEDDRRSRGPTRQQFLTGVGSGAAGVAIGAGPLAPDTAAAAAVVPRTQRFGRMFRDTAVRPGQPALQKANCWRSAPPGGLMDARDALDRGPIDLIVDLTLSRNNRNNPTHTAGTTFMGQFLDHDITFDTTSRLGTDGPATETPNSRTPAYDLDSVYGPAGSPSALRPRIRIKFRVEPVGCSRTCPELGHDTAILGDPRNDENLIMAGLQAAFLLFHNKAVDLVRSTNPLGR